MPSGNPVSILPRTPNIGKGLIGTVFKKSKAKKATILDTGFKVRDVDAEDGKMKMKKVSGLRREGPEL